MRAPLIGSTVTPIVVFLPLISIAGVEGVFFRALAITVATGLLTSLFLALTWTPTLSHYFIRRSSKEGSQAAGQDQGSGSESLSIKDSHEAPAGGAVDIYKEWDETVCRAIGRLPVVG